MSAMPSTFDALRQIMTPEMLSQLGRKVGMDEATVSRAGDVALPLIAAGMARTASTPEGATALYDQISQADSNILGHLSSFIGRFDVAAGAAKVRALLGPEAGAMMVSAERATGTDLAPLVAMLTPIMAGFLNNQVRTRHLDPVGLARLLQEGAQQELQTGRPAAATVEEAIAAGLPARPQGPLPAGRVAHAAAGPARRGGDRDGRRRGRRAATGAAGHRLHRAPGRAAGPDGGPADGALHGRPRPRGRGAGALHPEDARCPRGAAGLPAHLPGRGGAGRTGLGAGRGRLPRAPSASEPGGGPGGQGRGLPGPGRRAGQR